MSKLCLKEKWYNIPGNSKIKVKENKILNRKKYGSSRTREDIILSDSENYEVIINESGRRNYIN